ncbi:ORF6C domain-containing protein [Mediterraneibacter glycyrrhizinilyticus]
MNDLMNKVVQTPIEIALGIDENGMTTAKKLYEFLGMDLKNYSRWIRNNITENQFAEENVDYWVFVMQEENPSGGRPTQDYKLSASFAKKLSMMARSEKGEQARQYFVRVEDGMKEVALRLQNMSPELQAIIMHDKKIQQVESKVESVNQDLQDFKMDMPILGIEIDKITSAVKKKGVKCLGGKESNAYKDKSLRGKVYHDIYRELKRQFGVSTYKAIKRNQCDLAVEVIGRYELPYVLAEQIRDCNARISMEVA